jgi:hypothetical protein
MKIECKSASSPGSQGEMVGTLDALSPVLSGGECRIMARFRSGSREVVAFIEPEDFPKLVKALHRKGSLRGVQFVDAEKLLGRTCHLTTEGNQSTITRLKTLESTDQARRKADLDREMKELTAAKP